MEGKCNERFLIVFCKMTTFSGQAVCGCLPRVRIAVFVAAYPAALPTPPLPVPQLLVVSPLTRALQTAQLAFLPSYRQAPLVLRVLCPCAFLLAHSANLGPLFI